MRSVNIFFISVLCITVVLFPLRSMAVSLEDTLSIANDIVKYRLTEEDFTTFVQQYFEKSLKEERETLCTNKVKDIEQYWADYLKYDSVLEKIAEEIEPYFDKEELIEIRDFYASPVGQKFASKDVAFKKYASVKMYEEIALLSPGLRRILMEYHTGEKVCEGDGSY